MTPPFQIGDKVVCVDDSPARYPGRPLVRGGVYCVLDIWPSSNAPGVWSVEVYGDGDGWYHTRFEPRWSHVDVWVKEEAHA